MSDFLTVGRILDSEDIQYKELEIPEWKGKVLLKTLSGTERNKIEQMAYKFRKGEIMGYTAEIAVMACCGPDKKPLFTANDLPRLREKNGLALGRIFDAVNQQNNLIPEAIRDAEKN